MGVRWGLVWGCARPHSTEHSEMIGFCCLFRSGDCYTCKCACSCLSGALQARDVVCIVTVVLVVPHIAGLTFSLLLSILYCNGICIIVRRISLSLSFKICFQFPCFQNLFFLLSFACLLHIFGGQVIPSQ